MVSTVSESSPRSNWHPPVYVPGGSNKTDKLSGAKLSSARAALTHARVNGDSPTEPQYVALAVIVATAAAKFGVVTKEKIRMTNDAAATTAQRPLGIEGGLSSGVKNLCLYWVGDDRVGAGGRQVKRRRFG